MTAKPHNMRGHGRKPKPYTLKDHLQSENLRLTIENLKLKKLVRSVLG